MTLNGAISNCIRDPGLLYSQQLRQCCRLRADLSVGKYAGSICHADVVDSYPRLTMPVVPTRYPNLLMLAQARDHSVCSVA